MLENFKGFIGYSDEEFKNLWENALVVVDTNILIYFYKFSSKQSETLFNILMRLKIEERLWIPHQVALEYFHNYESNMSKQTEGYNSLKEKLLKLNKDAEKAFSTIESSHPYIEISKFKYFIDELKKSIDEVQEKITEEINELPKAEYTEKKVLELMDGIVGHPYTQDKINSIENEGGERYHNEVPPGWEDAKDNNKENIRTYGTLKYTQKYGDLILWNQMIDKAKGDQHSTPIIFITEDKKEDWWEKDKRGIKRPQPNLIHEFLEKTSQKFYMYRIDEFVKYAREYWGDGVPEQEVENFNKELEHIRKSDDKVEEMKRKNAKLMAYRIGVVSSLSKQFKDVQINKLMEYLVEEEKAHFKNELKIAFSENDKAFSTHIYDDAISWALNIASPRIVNKAIDLISTLGTLDYTKANEYRDRMYSEMPDETVPKGIMLLEFVEKLKNEIYELEDDGLPF
ncbi:PIN-like domain-containing protein [Piscibacillus salipiscarius]|uniref:PIN-like domain-containing protein n=1 Tax=Piscibacillus salipiscarius TaxID=299480 RepID=A0ABW5QDQ3_9BACI|nr:PIN-like domain-containing protein [Piscibacillus salipiscarius]